MMNEFDFMQHLVDGATKRVQHFLNIQVQDPDAPDFGSMKGDVIEGKPLIYMLATAAALYCCPNNEFYHDEQLLAAMNLGMDFVGRWQRENGALDYPVCNFNSAADTSFCFKRLISAWRIFKKYEPDGENPNVDDLKDKLETVMKRALCMIRDGGFHTPNHRWAITAALMQGHNLFGDEIPGLMERANAYLAEGIDGSADGEYAERSTGNYNAVVNNAMLAMYEESHDPTYLGYVVRNLHMMLTYIDPDDTVFTQNSTRQDQGKKVWLDGYFYQYLYVASLSDEEAGEYAKYRAECDAAAHKIILDNYRRGDLAPDCLHVIVRHPEMMKHVFSGYGYLDAYRKFYEDAGVLRVKKDVYGYSVLKGKSAFLYIKFGTVPIFVKIGESVGYSRNFLPETMEVTEHGCTLASTIYTEYLQPFGAYQGTSDWWKMDHSKREHLKNGELTIRLAIEEEENGLRLGLKAEGLSQIPLRVQICLPAQAILENEHFHLRTEEGGWMILKDDFVNLCMDDQVIEIGPGFGTHAFGGHYSGEETNLGGYTLYLNDYTPYEHEISIRKKH